MGRCCPGQDARRRRLGHGGGRHLVGLHGSPRPHHQRHDEPLLAPGLPAHRHRQPLARQCGWLGHGLGGRLGGAWTADAARRALGPEPNPAQRALPHRLPCHRRPARGRLRRRPSASTLAHRAHPGATRHPLRPQPSALRAAGQRARQGDVRPLRTRGAQLRGGGQGHEPQQPHPQAAVLGRPAARPWQARRARVHPAEARQADHRGVRGGQAPRRAGRRAAALGIAGLPTPGRHHPLAPRTLGRQGLPRRPEGRGDPPRWPASWRWSTSSRR